MRIAGRSATALLGVATLVAGVPAVPRISADAPPSGRAVVEIDPATGLVVDPRLPLVQGQCTVCHSAALITRTRASRETWESMIRWMQATQNLWVLPPPVETAILDYLGEHYAPTRRRGRRAPLDPALLPP